jgi:hypothetical protein
VGLGREVLVAHDLAGRGFDLTSAAVGVLGVFGVSVSPKMGVVLSVAGAARAAWQNRDLAMHLARSRARAPTSGG